MSTVVGLVIYNSIPCSSNSQASLYHGWEMCFLVYIFYALTNDSYKWQLHTTIRNGFTKSPILSQCFGLAHVNSVASCFVIYILHSKFSWFTIPPWNRWSFFPFLLPLYYRFVVIYLVAFLWSRVWGWAGWNIFISIYILTWRIQPTVIPIYN